MLRFFFRSLNESQKHTVHAAEEIIHSKLKAQKLRKTVLHELSRWPDQNTNRFLISLNFSPTMIKNDVKPSNGACCQVTHTHTDEHGPD